MKVSIQIPSQKRPRGFSLVLLLVGALGSLGAQHQTRNFLVEAPTLAIAKQVGEYAEHYRRTKALEWLGRVMPDWSRPCPLQVQLTMGGSGGATHFMFDNQGRILDIRMQINGTLERMLASVLPHEVTHTVLAHYFRAQVPRWADEGGAVLSEDDLERNKHEQLIREILRSPGRAMPLRRLFALKDYPPDVIVLYAQGYSVTRFLVEQSSRQVFLTFVAHGMRGDWDAAVRTHYRYRNVEELERAWVNHLFQGDVLARNNRAGAGGAPSGEQNRPSAEQVGQMPGRPVSRTVIRQSFPHPQLGTPEVVARGVRPEDPPLPVSTAPFARPLPAPAHGYPAPLGNPQVLGR